MGFLDSFDRFTDVGGRALERGLAAKRAVDASFKKGGRRARRIAAQNAAAAGVGPSDLRRTIMPPRGRRQQAIPVVQRASFQQQVPTVRPANLEALIAMAQGGAAAASLPASLEAIADATQSGGLLDPDLAVGFGGAEVDRSGFFTPTRAGWRARRVVAVETPSGDMEFYRSAGKFLIGTKDAGNLRRMRRVTRNLERLCGGRR